MVICSVHEAKRHITQRKERKFFINTILLNGTLFGLNIYAKKIKKNGKLNKSKKNLKKNVSCIKFVILKPEKSIRN